MRRGLIGVGFPVVLSLARGSFSYAWDFDGDGTIDEEVDQGMVDHAFSAPGFCRVVLTLTDEGGRRKTHTEGIIVGSLPAFAKRDVVTDSDGSLFVLITISISERSRALGFEDSAWVQFGDPRCRWCDHQHQRPGP